MLPANTQAVIDEQSWQWPAVFSWLQQAGNVTRHEMYRTFNCGVGMIIALAGGSAGQGTGPAQGRRRERLAHRPHRQGGRW